MQHMLYETDGRVAVITLNRPEKANAVSGLTLDEMNECFTRGTDDADVRVIVLRSNGKHFCAGHDLSGTDKALEKAAAGEGAPAKGSYVDWKERGLEAILRMGGRALPRLQPPLARHPQAHHRGSAGPVHRRGD